MARTSRRRLGCGLVLVCLLGLAVWQHRPLWAGWYAIECEWALWRGDLPAALVAYQRAYEWRGESPAQLRRIARAIVLEALAEPIGRLPREHSAAVEGVAWAGEEGVAALRALSQDRNSTLAVAALSALARRGEPGARQELLRMLSAHPTQARGAAWALCELQAPEALSWARSRSPADMSLDELEILAQAGDQPSDLDLLCLSLSEVRTGAVRIAAGQALVRFCRRQPAFEEQARQQLIRLEQSSTEASSIACGVLAVLGDPRRLESVRRKLLACEETWLGVFFAQVLDVAGDPQGSSYLCGWLGSEGRAEEVARYLLDKGEAEPLRLVRAEARARLQAGPIDQGDDLNDREGGWVELVGYTGSADEDLPILRVFMADERRRVRAAVAALRLLDAAGR